MTRRSVSGSPSTIKRSAQAPAAILPSLPSCLRSAALVMVGAHSAELRTDERIHIGKAATFRGQLLMELVPGMDQVWAHLQCYSPSAARATPTSRTEPSRNASAEPSCISMQGQSSQIGMDRRGKRRAGIDSIEACRRELDQIGFLDQRLDRRLRRHAPADDLEIDLWRTAPGAGRQGERFDSTN